MIAEKFVNRYSFEVRPTAWGSVNVIVKTERCEGLAYSVPSGAGFRSQKQAYKIADRYARLRRQGWNDEKAYAVANFPQFETYRTRYTQQFNRVFAGTAPKLTAVNFRDVIEMLAVL